MESLERSVPTKLLDVLQGLEVTLERLRCELLVAVNICDQCDVNNEVNPSPHDIRELLKTSFSRVLEFSEKGSAGVGEGNGGDNNNIHDLLKDIIVCCQEELLLYVGLLTLGTLVPLARDGQTSVAILCLELLLSRIDKVSKRNLQMSHVSPDDIRCRFQTSGESFRVSLTSPHRSSAIDKSVSLRDLALLHLGLYHLKEKNFESSSNLFTMIRQYPSFTPSRIPLIIYAQGFAHFRHGDCDQVMKLLSIWENQPLKSAAAAPELWNLFASYFARKGKVNAAVKLYRQALKVNPRFTPPMFNLAMLCGRQGVSESSLTTLKTMFTDLGSKHLRQSTRSFPQNGALRENPEVTAEHDLSVECVLYCLAEQCLNLKRFVLASQIYAQLLERLGSSTDAPQQQPSQKGVHEPTMTDTNLKLAFCLLKQDKLLETVTVCDRILNTAADEDVNDSLCNSSIMDTSDLTQCQPPVHQRLLLVECSDASTSGIDHRHHPRSLKRARSEDGSQDRDAILEFGGDSQGYIRDWCTALMYKSDALFIMGRVQKAVSCLDEIINCLESRQQTSQFDDSEDEKQAARQMPIKRQKLDLEEEAVGATTSDASRYRHRCTSLLVEATNKKAVAMASLGKVENALKMSSNALKLMPDDQTVVYNHCLMLLASNKPKESSDLWLRHRNLTRQHPVKLRKLLDETEAIAESTSEQSASVSRTLKELNKEELYNLDIVSIRYHLKLKE